LDLRVSSLQKKNQTKKLGPIERGNLSFHAKFQLKRTNGVPSSGDFEFVCLHGSYTVFVLTSRFSTHALLLKKVKKDQLNGKLGAVKNTILNLYSKSQP
jgi:hypothetical protein